MNKEPKSTIKVKFQDCDPFGHLNNVNYLKYFLDVREDHLLDYYDLDLFKMARKLGIAWVVGKTEIIYKNSAHVNEQVIIQTRLIRSKKKSVKIEMVMLHQENKHVKSIMWADFVHVDLKTQKPIDHNQDLEELLNKIIITLPPTSIEERLLQLTPN